jgi:hypothetical protein
VASPPPQRPSSLGERRRQDAIAAGRRSVVSEEFARVRPGTRREPLRDEPFTVSRWRRGTPPSGRDAQAQGHHQTAVKETDGKLTWVGEPQGPTADFARFYVPVLLDADRDKPTFAKRSTALREDGSSPRGVSTVSAASWRKAASRWCSNPDDKEVSTITVDLSPCLRAGRVFMVTTGAVQAGMTMDQYLAQMGRTKDQFVEFPRHHQIDPADRGARHVRARSSNVLVSTETGAGRALHTCRAGQDGGGQPQFEMRIFLRDMNRKLMEQYLIQGIIRLFPSSPSSRRT